MMEHLNYCRQMSKQFAVGVKNPAIRSDVRGFMSHCIDLAKASQKFMLPDGGRIYDDPDFRALDEEVPLSLPYPLIAVEFTRSDEYVSGHKFRHATNAQPRKSLLFARERDDCIVMTVVVWAENAGMWAPYPEIAIPRTHYIDRNIRSNGYACIRVMQNTADDLDVPLQDYGDECGALLSMLNVLQCNNVHIEQSHPSKLKRMQASGKSKRALPFDSYHILTISAPSEHSGDGCNGGHRSPREHLRRGHIRRLGDGRKVWVNATVVGAGKGSGVVRKDYRIAGGAFSSEVTP